LDFGLTTVKTVCDEHPYPTLTSLDDKWFYVSCWGTSEFRRFWNVKQFGDRHVSRTCLKLEGVVGLYLNTPEHAIVLCCDEKSQVQALDRRARHVMSLPVTSDDTSAPLHPRASAVLEAQGKAGARP